MESPPPLVTAPLSNPAETRKRYLNHEASIQSVGWLYLIGAVSALLGLLAMFLDKREPMPAGGLVVSSLILVALIALQVWLGLKLRKLDRAAKIPATILNAIGLLYFPWGTIINAYILYLLLSAKGTYVFSDEYRAIITATPEIKYKLSIITKLALGLFVVFVLFGVAAVLFGRK